MRFNKVFMLLLTFTLLLVIVGCDTDESSTYTTTEEITEDTSYLNDAFPPLLQIASAERDILINQGEEYDLMKGLSGLDNLDGDITNQIEYNIGSFNKDVPGVYEIYYFLVDSAGNAATSAVRVITVLDTAIYSAPPVYTGVIANEKPKPAIPNDFAGAWYHKVESARDTWYGIEGTITLPEVKLTRYENDTYNTSLDVDPLSKNLDNPSIYMGGNATKESDVGLSFSKGCLGTDCTLSRGSFMFRPFWRYITDTDYDMGGYDVHQNNYAVSCTGDGVTKNCIANWHYRDTQYYYLPGDKLRMIVFSPKPNYLQMQIEVIEKSTLPESIKIREDNGWEDPSDFKSPIFSSPGHGTGILAKYKRVNAIDQVANEGKPSINTTSEIMIAVWENSYLYRKIDGEMFRVPFTEARSALRESPDPTRFTSYYGDLGPQGGEYIIIHPGRTNTED